MNVRLRESENKAETAELFFDTEETKVIGVEDRKFVGSIFEREGKDRNLRTFDAFGEIGTRTFDLNERLFAWNDMSGLFNSVENTISDFLNDIVDSDGSTRVLETMAAMIASGGRKESAVGSKDVEADETGFFSDGNHGMENTLIQCFTDTNVEIREGSLTGNCVLIDPRPTSVVLAEKGIPQDANEVFGGSKIIEITKKIKEEKRNGIVARASEDGISVGDKRADEGEIDSRADEIKNTAGNESVVMDGNAFFFEFVMGEPASFFLWKDPVMKAIDPFVAFAKISDKMADIEARVFAHIESSGVSRENLRPSKTLPGSPFLMVKTSATTPPTQTETHNQTLALNPLLLSYLNCMAEECPAKSADSAKKFSVMNPTRAVKREIAGSLASGRLGNFGHSVTNKWVESEPPETANYCQFGKWSS